MTTQTLEPVRQVPFGIIPPVNVRLTHSEINTLKNVLNSYIDVSRVSSGEPDEDIINLEQILIKIS